MSICCVADYIFQNRTTPIPPIPHVTLSSSTVILTPVRSIDGGLSVFSLTESGKACVYGSMMLCGFQDHKRCCILPFSLGMHALGIQLSYCEEAQVATCSCSSQQPKTTVLTATNICEWVFYWFQPLAIKWPPAIESVLLSIQMSWSRDKLSPPNPFPICDLRIYGKNKNATVLYQ